MSGGTLKIMTIEARNTFLEWSSKRPKEHQKVLNVAILDSKEKREEINNAIAKQILNAVEEIIASK